MFAKTQPASDANPLRVTVTRAAPCRHTLQIQLAPVAVAPVREEVVKQIQKEAALAGFRKGKAPRELVEQKYPEEIRQETVRRLTRHVFEQVTEERKLKPVGPFEVLKLDFDDAKGLALEAQVEVEPEFALGDYRGIRLKKPAQAISQEDIDKALQQIRESMAQLVPTEEGKPKEKQLPNLDDEFAKDAGFESLEALTQHVESKLREQRRQRQDQALEQQLSEALLATHQLDVPAKLVATQAERLSRDFQVRLLMAGRTEEQVKEEMTTYTEQLRTNAIRLVKLAFILDRIAEQEQLSITQDEVVEQLWKLAKRWGKDPVDVRKALDAQGLWPSVLSSIRQDKTMRLLLEAAHVEEVTSDQ